MNSETARVTFASFRHDLKAAMKGAATAYSMEISDGTV